MFIRLHKESKNKIQFFDSILRYLSNNFSQPVSLDNIKSNIDYSDSRLEKVKGLGKFFEEDNIDNVYKKSLNLLIESGYVKKELNDYFLTVKGLSVVSSRGLVGKEKRDIARFNFQNWIWVIVIATFFINLLYRFFYHCE
tara:strand:- start:9481 stop:9900 length:420 start_codon:yes stop_codon:yes gene_type:complete